MYKLGAKTELERLNWLLSEVEKSEPKDLEKMTFKLMTIENLKEEIKELHEESIKLPWEE